MENILISQTRFARTPPWRVASIHSNVEKPNANVKNVICSFTHHVVANRYGLWNAYMFWTDQNFWLFLLRSGYNPVRTLHWSRSSLTASWKRAVVLGQMWCGRDVVCSSQRCWSMALLKAKLITEEEKWTLTGQVHSTQICRQSLLLLTLRALKTNDQWRVHRLTLYRLVEYLTVKM